MTTPSPSLDRQGVHLHAVGHARHAADVSFDGLRPAAQALLADGFRVASIAGHDDGDRVRAVYLFTAGDPDRRVELSLPMDPIDPRVPTLAPVSFPASRFEREMRDLYGIEPEGHPQPAPLVLHQHWPQGWHPMRRDAGPTPPMSEETQPFPFTPVEGPGVYEIPVGPVHAGLIEPGHFRFSVVGETILAMRARLWFVHKGLERLFETRTPADGLELAERVSGDTAVGHAWAYCQAIEDALGVQVPAPAQTLRAVLLELERFYNHTADMGALCNDVGFGIVHAHTLRIRERLLRLNARVTGHRLLRGGVFPGGAAVQDLPGHDELNAIAADLDEVIAMAMDNGTVVDRFTGTSPLSGDDARAIGTLGYVARASGLVGDARRDHSPHPDLYTELNVPVHDTGDVMARFQIRVEEFHASLALLHRLLPEAARAMVMHRSSSLPVPDSLASGVGIVEGWRGAIIHRVELRAGVITRAKIVDPSFMNWPALAVSLADTIVPDFPLTNKSFNLSYAGNDL